MHTEAISTSVEDNAAKEPLVDSNNASDSFRVDFNLNQRRNSKVIISLSSISFFRSFLLGTLTTAKFKIYYIHNLLTLTYLLPHFTAIYSRGLIGQANTKSDKVEDNLNNF